jgi:hypothetical protein
MLNKKCFGAVLLAAAAVSTTAMAQDRGANTVVGALAGAALGHAAGGRDGAIVGGVIGAAVGNSLPTRDDYYYRRGGSVTYYDAQPTYYAQPAYAQPVYSQPAPVYYDAPAPVVYESAPVYVSGPRYYAPPVVVVGGGRGYYHGYHGGHWRR